MRSSKKVSLQLFFLALTLFNVKSEVIEIEDGFIQGTTMQSRKGAMFHAFLKIPFARSPTGALRFQPPVRNERWQGVLNATAYGPMCIQSVGRYEISEDCLHLNVYTKNLMPGSLKPVIVFIHGGSYDQGSGRNYGPLYLMDRDVVLVTVNYRIGALGFLSTGTVEAVGNMGLKDQVLALKWIQRNIVRFGGNPASVTIAGLSAGGFSVTSHMASDMSKGLFHRVIVMSGSITGYSKFESNYLKLAMHLAAHVNCSTSNVPLMIKCMQEKPAESFMRVDLRPVRECPVQIDFHPVIENNFGQERFFSRNPLETFADSSKVAKIPVMAGLTEHEMYYLVPIALSKPQLMATLNNDLESFTYKCFHLKLKPADLPVFRALYFPFDKIDSRSFNGLGNYFSDGSIGYGSHRLVQMLSNHTDVYYYKFTYIGRHSVFNYPRDRPFGMSHADDIQYVLNTWYVGPDLSVTDPEYSMVERMTRIWEQFAWRGDPNNSTDDFLSEMNWPRHSAESEYYLEIGQHLIEKRGLFLERFAVWDRFQKSAAASMKSFNLLLSAFISLLAAKLA